MTVLSGRVFEDVGVGKRQQSLDENLQHTRDVGIFEGGGQHENLATLTLGQHLHHIIIFDHALTGSGKPAGKAAVAMPDLLLCQKNIDGLGPRLPRPLQKSADHNVGDAIPAFRTSIYNGNFHFSLQSCWMMVSTDQQITQALERGFHTWTNFSPVKNYRYRHAELISGRYARCA
jgi:hypothetical protein